MSYANWGYKLQELMFRSRPFFERSCMESKFKDDSGSAQIKLKIEKILGKPQPTLFLNNFFLFLCNILDVLAELNYQYLVLVLGHLKMLRKIIPNATLMPGAGAETAPGAKAWSRSRPKLDCLRHT